MLWIPGPTEVRPELLAECARPAIGHRSADMRELIERVDPHLPWAFGLDTGSDAHVGVHSTSASGLMEASLRGVGARVLAVVNGAFSRRFFQMAELLGKDVERLDVAWGAGVEPDELAARLERDGPFDAVTLVANETSTGVRTPLAGLTEVLAAHGRPMFLVDVVSLIAGAPVDFDAHAVDFAFAGVQKALALPPGIAVCCASQRYMAGARAIERGSWALDPVRIIEGHAARKTPATPCTPLYYGLARQLEDISAGVTLPAGADAAPGAAAWDARFARHERMRSRTAAWAASHGLAPFPQERFASPTVSCVAAGSLDTAAFVAGLAERGFSISNGYGDLKGRTFRIGHMGDHTEEALEELLAAADAVLAGLSQRA
ncbi:MAG: aminotransferase class V-fold PLP-dependent enzyme [Planctomycetota bacterium]|jgi:aspartate aminotransferase-like enzyme|nr:aminotransferase class V-fold PLP-dependent enzyme [Planctomycetota bacterium]MDP6764356.1 aminotransferase class V-fold PLP-dependent enzyme [Planctomycetota bacterium]MDP6988114.1 aminotransferase class V-fold PLP-dependent enzyme [Planctomycetota bacterium]